MRKIIAANSVTLDGFFAGPKGETDWFVWDKELEEYIKNLVSSVGGILFGRVTYELMAGFWTAATTEDPTITDAMNNLYKFVFSRTLNRVGWNNSRLLKGDIAEEVKKLKQWDGKDIVIYGSGSIVRALTALGLIDDYRIFVNPVLLGQGKPLFVGDRLNLRLVQTKTFPSGVVLLEYQPDRQG